MRAISLDGLPETPPARPARKRRRRKTAPVTITFTAPLLDTETLRDSIKSYWTAKGIKQERAIWIKLREQVESGNAKGQAAMAQQPSAAPSKTWQEQLAQGKWSVFEQWPAWGGNAKAR